MTDQEKSLIEFPCDFPIKIMGKNHIDLETAVVSIFNRHVEDFGEDAMRSRQSKNGNYISITVTIVAESQDQLDNIYRELSSHELVMMAL
ncbi:MAG: DUF493 domain-containing protein [Gammaproteobacteria bacterium]|nr:DUF493 domain-containing protein [Gammaproteobacteria bacterium]